MHLTARWIPRNLFWNLKHHPVYGRLYQLLCLIFKGYSYLLCADHLSKWPEFQNVKIKPVGTLFYIWKVSSHFMGYETNLYQIMVPNFPAKLSDNFQGIMVSFTLPSVLTSLKLRQTTFTEMFWSLQSHTCLQKYNNLYVKNVPSTVVFGRRLQNKLNSFIVTSGINNVGMQNIQKRLITRKYQQKLNVYAHAGKELRDFYSV